MPNHPDQQIARYNNLGQQIAGNWWGHNPNGFVSGIRRKCRNVILQIFGHEALFNTESLIINSHCGIFNVDIYRPFILKFEHLSKRKLFNPFKWLEFLVVFPLEILNYVLVILLIPLPVANIAINIATGVVRRALAPARYIIRPSIELARSNPYTFVAIVCITLIAAAFLASAVFSGGLSVALGGLLLTATVATKAACFSAAVIGLWSGLLKLCNLTRDIHTTLTAPAMEQQRVEQFISGSTAKISETLHAMDPEHTEMYTPEDKKGDRMGYQLALFTGTESLFYKKKSKKTTCKSETIPYSQAELANYQLKHPLDFGDNSRCVLL